jgi:hypothetical protein
MNRLLPLLCIALALAACRREDPEAVAAAQRAAREQAASAQARLFEDAYAQQNWELARGHGEGLLMEHPDSEAAARIKERLEHARAQAEQTRQRRRLAALWSYAAEPVQGGTQLSASLYSQEPVDADGSGARPVRLIFRDHPAWGRSSYLVLERGDFDCYRGCGVMVPGDAGGAKALAATRPQTDAAIALFIEDERTLWRMMRDAKTLAIEFPTRAAGSKTAVFEIGGLDRSRLPGWD